MTTVDELAELTGWTGRSYVDTPWHDVERLLGVRLPASYKELLDIFPPGVFRAPDLAQGHVEVYPPYNKDYLAQYEEPMAELRVWRADHPADVRHPVFPDVGGMLPWGLAPRECFLWVRGSDDPEQWTVAISNGGIWRYDNNFVVVEEFDLDAVGFLVRMVRGEITSQVLNPAGDTAAELGRPNAFTPLPEITWHDLG